MTVQDSILTDAADRIFRELATPDVFAAAEEGDLPRVAWQALEEAGLSKATAGEDRGGAGASARDVAAILQYAATHALPLPLAETLIAERMLAAAGLPPHDGPVTVGPVI